MSKLTLLIRVEYKKSPTHSLIKSMSGALYVVVPAVGLEPTRLSTGDFEYRRFTIQTHMYKGFQASIKNLHTSFHT